MEKMPTTVEELRALIQDYFDYCDNDCGENYDSPAALNSYLYRKFGYRGEELE